LDNDLLQNSLKIYYPSGAIALYQEYDDGYVNGDSIAYYESGAIASKVKLRLSMATCDNKCKDYVSLIDGDYYEYFEDSSVKTHIKYNKGVIDTIVQYNDSSHIYPSTNYTIVN
jgi:antitoxin component YwqK of YwqJK toxin-antitoxin module